MLYRYGITLEQYAEMLERQHGVCAICEQGPSHQQKHLDIDHDHACCPRPPLCGHCVRGLLCRLCNVGLGDFFESIKLLESAIEYLEAAR